MEAHLAGVLPLDVAVAVALMAAASSTSSAAPGPREEIVGANDVDEIEEDASDRAGEQLEATGIGRGALRRRGQRHRARGDAEEPVRERRDARIEAHVGDRDVDRDRPERPEHERTCAERGDRLRARIGQRHASSDQKRRVLARPAGSI